MKDLYFSFVRLTDLLINGGNVGGGATVVFGISFPIIPIPCNCSGRSEVDDWRLKPPLPAIFLKRLHSSCCNK